MKNSMVRLRDIQKHMGRWGFVPVSQYGDMPVECGEVGSIVLPLRDVSPKLVNGVWESQVNVVERIFTGEKR